MKDYYKIGEISKIYGFSKDSLMYYEDLGILKPDRDTNGYRMYSIQDLYRLNLIKELISKIYGFSKDSLMYYEDLGILKPDRDTNGYRMYSIQDLYRLNLIKELYEDLGILKPDRDTNGYRMYSIQDLYRLNLIKELRTLGFSMKKIKEYLENRNLKTTEEILNEELILTETKIKDLNSQKNNIINRLKAIAESKEITDFENIELKYIEKRKAIELNANITRDEEFDFCVQKLQNEYEGRFDILGNNNIGSFFSEEALKKEKQ